MNEKKQYSRQNCHNSLEKKMERGKRCQKLEKKYIGKILLLKFKEIQKNLANSKFCFLFCRKIWGITTFPSLCKNAVGKPNARKMQLTGGGGCGQSLKKINSDFLHF